MCEILLELTPESFITVVVGEYMSLLEGEHSANPSNSFLICVIPPGETSPGTAVSVIIDTWNKHSPSYLISLPPNKTPT